MHTLSFLSQYPLSISIDQDATLYKTRCVFSENISDIFMHTSTVSLARTLDGYFRENHRRVQQVVMNTSEKPVDHEPGLGSILIEVVFELPLENDDCIEVSLVNHVQVRQTGSGRKVSHLVAMMLRDEVDEYVNKLGAKTGPTLWWARSA